LETFFFFLMHLLSFSSLSFLSLSPPSSLLSLSVSPGQISVQNALFSLSLSLPEATSREIYGSGALEEMESEAKENAETNLDSP